MHNKGFEEWGESFGDEVIAAALVDRLVHHLSPGHDPRQQLLGHLPTFDR
jgi:hypothetical protein